MFSIIIKPITSEDIPAWSALSREYDEYVNELVLDLTQWYEGNETDIAFVDYMHTKIKKNEAFMAFCINTNKCLGIIAFSRSFNRITFWGISHVEEFNKVGEMLLNYALNELNTNIEISITLITSNAIHIKNKRELLNDLGFICIANGLENGVPIDKMIKRPSFKES